MKRTLAAVFAVALLAGACESTTDSNPTPPEPAVTEDSFNSNTLSSYTVSTDGGFNWVIENGTLVGTGPAIQSVLVRNGVTMTNGWVETTTSHADDGGLVLRYQHGGDYYLLAFRDDGAPAPRGMLNLALYHRNNGDYDEFWRKDISWPRGSARTIRFQAEGSVLRVFVNGVLEGEVIPAPAINDPFPYSGQGSIGVRHYGDTSTWRTVFDVFRWHIG